MIVVVVPDGYMRPDQIDYPGGVYTYGDCDVKEAFRRFTLNFIGILNQLYTSNDRAPISELPINTNHWKPIASCSVVNDHKGYLNIDTPSAYIAYAVYAYSDTMECLYSWKEYEFDKIFNNIVGEQYGDQYVCRVFSTVKHINTITIYAKNPEDLRVRLRGMFNKDGRLKQVSTSDNSNTSFGELFYTDTNRLEYVIMAEKKNN